MIDGWMDRWMDSPLSLPPFLSLSTLLLLMSPAISLTHPPTHPTANEELCHNNHENLCHEERGYDYLGSIILLFSSQLLVGVAICIMFSIGITFLDDNISNKTYPIYYSESPYR